MKVTRLLITAAAVVILAFLLIVWWQPILVHLSQETGSSESASRSYNFWSGFGSDLGEVTIVVGIFAAYRHHSCHVKGCPRLGKPVDGTPYLACPKHHPDHAGAKRGVRFEELVEAHLRGERAPESDQKADVVVATTAATDTGSVTAKPPTPKEQSMSLLSDIEHRFEPAVGRVISDVEAAARSKIGQTLLGAAKEILPLLPEGREASLVVTKLEEVEAWAHRALSTAPADPTEPAAPAAAPPTTEPTATASDAASTDQAAPAAPPAA